MFLPFFIFKKEIEATLIFTHNKKKVSVNILLSHKSIIIDSNQVYENIEKLKKQILSEINEIKEIKVESIYSLKMIFRNVYMTILAVFYSKRKFRSFYYNGKNLYEIAKSGMVIADPFVDKEYIYFEGIKNGKGAIFKRKKNIIENQNFDEEIKIGENGNNHYSFPRTYGDYIYAESKSEFKYLWCSEGGRIENFHIIDPVIEENKMFGSRIFVYKKVRIYINYKFSIENFKIIRSTIINVPGTRCGGSVLYKNKIFRQINSYYYGDMMKIGCCLIKNIHTVNVYNNEITFDTKSFFPQIKLKELRKCIPKI